MARSKTSSKISKPARGRPSKNVSQNEHQSEAANSTSRHVDAEESYLPSRKMSIEYGHGHMLGPEELEEPISNPPGTKRKRYSSDAISPSKRVRFNPGANETREIQEGEVRSRPVSPAAPPQAPRVKVENTPHSNLDEAQELMLNPAQTLLENLAQCPESLSLRTVADLFKALQSETEVFGKTWFGFKKHVVKDLGGEHSSKRFPLHELEHTYPALFWTTTNILDVPTEDAQRTWLKYFTRPAQRQALVYGILGEWLSQRVFKDPSFGLCKQTKQKMTEEVDIAYIHYDSFVRSKKRADLVKAAFGPRQRDLTLQALKTDSGELADELMIVLAPLLPTWTVDDPFGQHLNPVAAAWKQEMRLNLVELITKAAGLNLSLTHTGEYGTVFRIAPKLERGREYNPLAPMDCINLDEKMANVHKNPEIANEKKLMVRMTCWARIEAYKPCGMDQEEMELVQEEFVARKIERVLAEARMHDTAPTVQEFEDVYKKFCWDCEVPEAFPELPDNLLRTFKETVDRIEMKARVAKLERKTEQERAHQLREGVDGLDETDFFGSDDSESNSETDYHDITTFEGKTPVPKSAYLTVYDKLVNHQVYCEWVKPNSDEDPTVSGSAGNQTDGKDWRDANSLRSVVRTARNSSRSNRVKMANIRVKAWNLYAANNLWIEWASALALVIYLSRGNSAMSLSALTVKVKDLVFARCNDLHQIMHTLFPELWRVEHSATEFIDKVLEGVSGRSALLPKLFERLTEVIPMPTPFEHSKMWSQRAPAGFGSAAAFRTAIISAVKAVLPGHVPIAPLPPTVPRQIQQHQAIATGPAIPLTFAEFQHVKPTPSHHAQWW